VIVVNLTGFGFALAAAATPPDVAINAPERRAADANTVMAGFINDIFIWRCPFRDLRANNGSLCIAMNPDPRESREFDLNNIQYLPLSARTKSPSAPVTRTEFRVIVITGKQVNQVGQKINQAIALSRH
jgi:hypothetical protein